MMWGCVRLPTKNWEATYDLGGNINFFKSHLTERWEPSCPSSPFCEGGLQKGVVPAGFEEESCTMYGDLL